MNQNGHATPAQALHHHQLPHSDEALGALQQGAQQLATEGYAVLSGIYSAKEIADLLRTIEAADTSSSNFRRSQDVFAIRNLLGEIPALQEQLLTPKLHQVLAVLFSGSTPHLTKAIYFDKPAGSNWLVAWHQDVMIAVGGRIDLPGYGPWTTKQGETTVLPTRQVLESIVTIRLHLDDCDATNGALKVVPGSHQHGVLSNDTLPAHTPHAVTCSVAAGGVMLMKPLTLHASNRSTSARPRRVIHLEFSAAELPQGLQWRERLDISVHN
ncbi:phytanoyl-CoA dioxygenase family protein [Hymenobacter volaticus]|uniref:Phytanoyl-CoA dioxygenase family protein n=1 Tax=Hymenobacter volaticus TaxID=2932254 RepID=A0ABY4G1F9_9BACT|nr:phytanoyl-CoA dioxygenase family protein [Hymenobacter volaticus]UOQ64671.1 phytanoyl-CoA dioxygenase family protein [Hymenobacter volaticus]